MQKRPAGPGMHIIRDHRPKIYHRTVRHLLTSTSHRETGCKGDIVITNRLGRRHLSIGLDASLKAEKPPAKIAFLHIAVIAQDLALSPQWSFSEWKRHRPRSCFSKSTGTGSQTTILRIAASP